MQIKLASKEMVKEVLGKVIYLGCEQRYEYDQEKRERTDKVLSTTVHLGCEKLENSIDVNVQSNEAPDIANFGEVAFEGLVYDPYATATSYEDANGRSRSSAKVVERFVCESLRDVKAPVVAK